MLDTLDRADHAVVQQWITLADVVAQRQSDPHAYQSRGSLLVSSALDALLAYEHQIPAYLRFLAREVLFRRDFPTTPLPADRDWWAWCQCRSCHLGRRYERRDRRPAAYDAQLAALRRQQRRA